MEFFGWRAFRNRREGGALAGLTPTPYQSGEMSREQGIGKAGNRYIRAMAIEIAWGWLRFQPQSELSQWYEAVRPGEQPGATDRHRGAGAAALSGVVAVPGDGRGADRGGAQGLGAPEAHAKRLGSRGPWLPPGSSSEPTVSWGLSRGLRRRRLAHTG
jgi:hypothetical protein